MKVGLGFGQAPFTGGPCRDGFSAERRRRQKNYSPTTCFHSALPDYCQPALSAGPPPLSPVGWHALENPPPAAEDLQHSREFAPRSTEFTPPGFPNVRHSMEFAPPGLPDARLLVGIASPGFPAAQRSLEIALPAFPNGRRAVEFTPPGPLDGPPGMVNALRPSTLANLSPFSPFLQPDGGFLQTNIEIGGLKNE